jgi:hypothetical protein
VEAILNILIRDFLVSSRTFQLSTHGKVESVDWKLARRINSHEVTVALGSGKDRFPYCQNVIASS